MTIRKIAKLVRDQVEEDVACGLDIVDNEATLEGACGYASYGLCRMLPGSTFVYGHFIHKGRPNGHAWVEYKNKIIDITATQFGINSRILITKKDGTRAKRYVAGRRGKDAIQDLKDWDYPDGWMQELPRRLKRKIKPLPKDK